MAESGGIRRWVRLLLDKVAATKMQKESQQALDKATDPKKSESNISRIGKGWSALKLVALGAIAAITAALVKGITTIARWQAALIGAANEAEQVWNTLRGTLRNVGVDLDAQAVRLGKLADAFQRTTRFDDEQFASTLQRLVSITRDYEASIRLVSLAADVAIGSGKSLEESAELVAKAHEGNIKGLKALGVQLKATETGVQALARVFGGLAENEGKLLGTRLGNLREAWGNFKESLGEALKTVYGGVPLVQVLTDRLRDALAFIERNGVLWRWLASILTGTWRLLAAGANALRPAVLQLGKAWEFFLDVIGRIPEVLDHIAIAWNKLLQMRPFTSAETKKFLQEDEQRLREILGLHQELRKALNDERAIRRQLYAEAQRAARAGIGLSGLAGPPPRGVLSPGKEEKRETPAARDTPRVVPVPRLELPQIGVPRDVEERAEAFREQQRAAAEEQARIAEEQFLNIVGIAQGAASEVVDSWANVFEMMVRGTLTVGGAFESLGKGIAKSMLGSIAQFAAGQVAQHVAGAIGSTAWAASLGFINPVAAGKQAASVGLHLKAAAAWGALAAVSAGGAGAFGGGGGVGGGGGSPATGHTAQQLPRERSIINVWVDGIDPGNPRHQDLVYQVGQQASERFGGEVRIRRRS